MENFEYSGLSIWQKKEISGNLIKTSDGLFYIVPSSKLYLDINGHITCDECLDFYEVDKDTVKKCNLA